VPTPEEAVVRAWHEALNAADLERLGTLTNTDVEVGGPQGAGRGIQILEEWVARAGIRLEPLRIFQRGTVLVVEEAAEWRTAATGDVTGREVVASVFGVQGGQISSVVRHPDAAVALDAAGLDPTDQR
jgi:hypothetical protein